MQIACPAASAGTGPAAQTVTGSGWADYWHHLHCPTQFLKAYGLASLLQQMTAWAKRGNRHHPEDTRHLVDLVGLREKDVMTRD